MRILVVGGAGYIGSRLVPALLERGYAVDVLDLLWFGNHLPLDVRVIQRDLFYCDMDELRAYEQIIFLGGLSEDPMAEYSPAEDFIQNGAAPAYLAFAAKKAGVRRLIYASSCSVYGYAQDRLYGEDEPTTCVDPYGISKLQGERAALQLLDEAFSVIALRQGAVCGLSPRMRFDVLVNSMFKGAHRDRHIVVNHPSIWRPLLDIRDAVSGFLRAVQASYSVSGVFNVASGNYTVGQAGDEVKEEIERLSGRPVVLEIDDAKGLHNCRVSIDRARVELGFAPRHTIRDTVAEIWQHRDEYGDFEEESFYNIRVFKSLIASSASA